jgi:putative tricarboxylic transport membrane protein
MSEQNESLSGKGRLRIPQDVGGGLFLICIGIFALWQGSNLPLGTLRSMGAGMLPISLAWMLIGGGALLAVTGFFDKSEYLDAWSLRGLFFVLAGILTFSFTVQKFGLIVAGPAVILVGSMATSDMRWKESIIFAVTMTAMCILLFKYALGLPIPVTTFNW